jgi:transcription antitermination factor NusG
MDNTIADLLVGDQARVAVGAFEGYCGTVLEVQHESVESPSSPERKYLVQIRAMGRRHPKVVEVNLCCDVARVASYNSCGD